MTEKTQKIINLFKIAVKEAIREELPKIISETIKATAGAMSDRPIVERTNRIVSQPSSRSRDNFSDTIFEDLKQQGPSPDVQAKTQKIIKGDIKSLMEFVSPDNIDPDYDDISGDDVNNLINGYNK